MARRIVAKFGLAVSAAAIVLSLTVGAALAGEITGNGKTLEPLHAKSICAYSGQNDDPTGIDPEHNGPPGRTQSYGQDVRKGFISRKSSTQAWHAGVAVCELRAPLAQS